MQVFIVGTPLYTAEILDKKRLNKQIIECVQLLNAIKGISNAWKNHPCAIQYRDNVEWLENYMLCIKAYRDGDIDNALSFNNRCVEMTPSFHIEEYFNQMKRRLFTKNQEHYKQWRHLGVSNENWYWVDNNWKKYINGKIQ